MYASLSYRQSKKKKGQEKEPVQQVFVLFSVPDIYLLLDDPEYIYTWYILRATRYIKLLITILNCVCVVRLNIIVN